MKIGTATIIINELISCVETFDISRISRTAATGCSYHATQRRNY